MGMIVRLHFVLEIADLLLELFHLFFEGLKTLFGLGVTVTTVLFGHGISLLSASYVSPLRNSMLDKRATIAIGV